MKQVYKSFVAFLGLLWLSGAATVRAAPNPVISVDYDVHVSKLGWKQTESDGRFAGNTSNTNTTERIEALRIRLDNRSGISGGIAYKVHQESVGWLPSTDGWNTNNGASLGTTGISKQLESVSVRLTGELSNYYFLDYAVKTMNQHTWGSDGKPHLDVPWYLMYAELGCMDKSLLQQDPNWNITGEYAITDDFAGTYQYNLGLGAFRCQVVPRVTQYQIQPNGGVYGGTTNVTTGYVSAHSDMQLSSNPSRAGYFFSGYTISYAGASHMSQNGFQPVSKNIPGSFSSENRIYSSGNMNVVFTANWIPISYQVHYNQNGGTGGSMLNSQHLYDQDSRLSANAYVKQCQVTLEANGGSCGTRSVTGSFSFAGWSRTSTGGVVYQNQASVRNLAAASGHVVGLYAIWNPNAVSLPTASRTGYTFCGWSTVKNSTSGVMTYTPSKDTTLYAIWSPNIYTLTYMKNSPNAVSDVTLSKTVQTSVYGQPWGSLGTASKPGYLFQGWFTTATGGVSVTQNTIVKGNLMAYAHWKPITYTLRFHPNAENGTGIVTGTMSDTLLTYDMALTLPVNTYEKTIVTPSEDADGESRKTPAVFKGWSAVPEQLTASWTDASTVRNLSKQQGTIIDLYAIWDDAPMFRVDAYPNRYFTLDEARAGVITEAELLQTVMVSSQCGKRSWYCNR